MRRKSLVPLIVSLIVGVSLLVAACAPAAPAPGVPEVPEEKPMRLTVVAGSMGGSTQRWAAAATMLLMEQLDVEATVLTWNTSDWERAIHEGIADFGMAKVNGIYNAILLVGPYAEYPEPMTDLRPLYYVMPAVLQIVVLADSPYETFRDLIGKRISPSFPGSAPPAYLQAAIPAMGLSYEDDFDMVTVGSHKDGSEALIAGKIEAYFVVGAPPQPTMVETDLVHPLRLIGFTEEDMKAIIANCPYYAARPIPPDYYHMEESVLTFGCPTLATATNRLPEDIAYILTKSYIESPDVVRSYHSGFAGFIVEGLQKDLAESVVMPVPYHPGAYRYYKEVGWNIPAEMIPPEAK